MVNELDKRLVKTKEQALELLGGNDPIIRSSLNRFYGSSVIDNTNELIVSDAFFDYYADFILKMLKIGNEDAELLICDFDRIFEFYRNHKMPMANAGRHLHINRPMQYVWLTVNKCKNEKFYKYIREHYSGGTMYFSANSNTFMLPMLPFNDFRTLDRFCNIISNFY